MRGERVHEVHPRAVLHSLEQPAVTLYLEVVPAHVWDFNRRVVDLDLQFGDAAIMLGIEPDKTIQDLVTEVAQEAAWDLWLNGQRSQ